MPKKIIEKETKKVEEIEEKREVKACSPGIAALKKAQIKE